MTMAAMSASSAPADEWQNTERFLIFCAPCFNEIAREAVVSCFRGPIDVSFLTVHVRKRI